MNRPTLNELIESAKARMGSKYPHSFRNVLGEVLGGLSHMLHGHIEFMIDQGSPLTAKGEYLDTWGTPWGIKRRERLPASATIKVIGQEGVLCPKNWVIDGVNFTATNQKLIKNGSAELHVVASSTFLNSSAQIASINQTTSGIDGTANVLSFTPEKSRQSDESLRAEILAHIPRLPDWGKTSDYVKWGQSLNSIYKIWVRPTSVHGRVGEVDICFVDSNMQSNEIVKKQLAELFDNLAPAHAKINIVQLKSFLVPLEFEITPSHLKPQATENLKKLFFEESAPRGWLNSNELTSGSIPLSKIRQAIWTVEGEESHVITSHNSDLIAKEGEILTYG